MPPAVIGAALGAGTASAATVGTIALAGAAVAGSSILSARQERKSAEAAANAQRDIAAKQLQAAKDSEQLAQDTANKQLKAARARKTDTILTSPLGASVDQNQINQPTILGVPS